MKEMWDSRYSEEGYAYGSEPNVFLKEVIEKNKLAGKMLFPAEGEGRNAVFAAKKGLDVYAFDISIEGQKKAIQLAEQENVSIHYQVGDFFEMDLINQQYDAAALIYAHFPPPVLSKFYQKVGELVKPGGMIILEGFSKGNLPLREANPEIGGPNTLEMLFSTESIKNEFPHFEIIQLEEVEVELAEGKYHIGKGKVVRFIGRKTRK